MILAVSVLTASTFLGITVTALLGGAGLYLAQRGKKGATVLESAWKQFADDLRAENERLLDRIEACENRCAEVVDRLERARLGRE